LTNSSENGVPTAASNVLLDSSAVLALVLQEPGADTVLAAVDRGASIGAVNLSEVISRLVRDQWTDAEIREAIEPLTIPVISVDESIAWQAGLLSRETARLGLSLGDRYCLALGRNLGLPVMTADRVWAELDVGVEVVVCR
jgi:PIN domain nuclease of toxin-antitoxin system